MHSRPGVALQLVRGVQLFTSLWWGHNLISRLSLTSVLLQPADWEKTMRNSSQGYPTDHAALTGTQIQHSCSKEKSLKHRHCIGGQLDKNHKSKAAV